MQRLHHKLGIFGSCPILLLQDRRITPNGLRVYLACQSFAGTNEDAWPSRDTLAKRAGISPHAVTKAVALLVRTGWLLCQQRFALSSVYRCLAYSDPVPAFAEGPTGEIDKRHLYEQPKTPQGKNPAGDGSKRRPQKVAIRYRCTRNDCAHSKRNDCAHSKRNDCAPKRPSEKTIEKTKYREVCETAPPDALTASSVPIPGVKWTEEAHNATLTKLLAEAKRLPPGPAKRPLRPELTMSARA